MAFSNLLPKDTKKVDQLGCLSHSWIGKNLPAVYAIPPVQGVMIQGNEVEDPHVSNKASQPKKSPK